MEPLKSPPRSSARAPRASLGEGNDRSQLLWTLLVALGVTFSAFYSLKGSSSSSRKITQDVAFPTRSPADTRTLESP
jgi:hypothetical protein